LLSIVNLTSWWSERCTLGTITFWNFGGLCDGPVWGQMLFTLVLGSGVHFAVTFSLKDESLTVITRGNILHRYLWSVSRLLSFEKYTFCINFSRICVKSTMIVDVLPLL
jgi:hypothetical protein